MTLAEILDRLRQIDDAASRVLTDKDDIRWLVEELMRDVEREVQQ